MIEVKAKTIADILWVLRDERGLTAKAVAVAAGINEMQYHRLEDGEVLTPQIHILMKLADVYGLTLNDFEPYIRYNMELKGAAKVTTQYLKS